MKDVKEALINKAIYRRQVIATIICEETENSFGSSANNNPKG